jgi:hypothetical protein
MSIYATLWQLKFPRYGDDHTGCDWIAVMAQGVPAHVGAPASDADGWEEDPYAAFLPPVGAAPHDDDGQAMRAVVFVVEGTPKGTAGRRRSTSVPSLCCPARSTPPSRSTVASHDLRRPAGQPSPGRGRSVGPEWSWPGRLRGRQRSGDRERRRLKTVRRPGSDHPAPGFEMSGLCRVLRPPSRRTAAHRKQSTTWSLTIPTDCMNA